MKRPVRVSIAGIIFVSVLLLILAVFSGGAYYLFTSNLGRRPDGSLDALSVFLLFGGVIGLLAFLTGLFFFIGRLAGGAEELPEASESEEPANYGAPRLP